VCQAILKQFILHCQNHVNLHSINSLPSTFAFALASAYEFPVLKFVGTQTTNALALLGGWRFFRSFHASAAPQKHTSIHPSLSLKCLPTKTKTKPDGRSHTLSPFQTRNRTFHHFLSLLGIPPKPIPGEWRSYYSAPTD
jgi:hypothetical protein